LAISYITFIYKAGEPMSTRLASLAMDTDDFESSGFTLSLIVPTQESISVIEGIRA
jgi:hypothetical protein